MNAVIPVLLSKQAATGQAKVLTGLGPSPAVVTTLPPSGLGQPGDSLPTPSPGAGKTPAGQSSLLQALMALTNVRSNPTRNITSGQALGSSAGTTGRSPMPLAFGQQSTAPGTNHLPPASAVTANELLGARGAMTAPAVGLLGSPIPFAPLLRDQAGVMSAQSPVSGQTQAASASPRPDTHLPRITQTPSSGVTPRAETQGGRMLSPEGINMMPRPNTVYVEGAAAGVRIEPEQARTLGLRAGETINAVVTQRQDGNVLLIGKQQLPLPDRMNLPQGQVSLLVRVVAGQTILALTDPALAAQVAAATQRTEADARFARLLNHVGSFHLARMLSPGVLTNLAEQSGSPQMQRGLAALLLNSRELGPGNIRNALENTGLFAEHQASANAQQAAPGLKSMLIALRALMQARQLETTGISGAIDEMEARQLDSLAQQTAGRTHYSWVLPFADQYPVYIELEHQQAPRGEEGAAQSAWSVDLEVGLTPTVSMAANARVDDAGGLGLRLWLPEPNFYRMAQAGRTQLEDMIASQGLFLTGLTVYPVARDAGKVDYGQSRMGVSIDA